MSDNQAIVRYNYRLRPGAVAEARLELEWNCARWVWNQCVEAGINDYAAFRSNIEHESPTWCRMAKKLTAWRAEHEWLRKGSQVVQSQEVRRWSQSHQQAFKQPDIGFPKFKSSKNSLPSLEYTNNGFRIKNERLCLANGISIPVVWSRELPTEPNSCAVSRDIDGHWTVSFVTRRDNEELPGNDSAIGIDWGVAKVATTTDLEFDLPCSGQANANEQMLKNAQRKLSRAKRYSKGYFSAKLELSRIHLAIARQRRDRAFKWAHKVVANFGRIAVEDFKPEFLAKSAMAKKAADGAVGMTKQILINMAKGAGRMVVLVPAAFTTMGCSECGTIAKSRLKLSNRTFTCHACGYTADRDRNAARTIRARAGFVPTNAEDVRPAHDFCCALAV